MRQYYQPKEIRRVVLEFNTLLLPERRNRITFRFENDDERKNIPRNEVVIVESDDLTVTTDESDAIIE